jgi:hypothetical protein
LIAGLELILRLSSAWSGHSAVVANGLDACRLVPGLDYGAGLRGNRLGYPGPDADSDKRPGVLRVAALGDSFLVGPVVPFRENFLMLLQAHLPGTEVCNFGVSGAGPREYNMIVRRDVLAMRPDLVLVCLFVTNDVVEELPTPRHLDPRQHSVYWLWKHLAAPRPSSPDPVAPGSEELLDHRIRTGTLSPADFARLETMRLAVCRVPTPPGIEKKWRRTWKDLDSLLRACGREGVPVAFVLVPDEAQADPDSLRTVIEHGRLDPEQLDLALPQRRFLEFARGRGTPCLDLLPAFAGRPNLYCPRNTHWNRAGNRLAAEEIARWLPMAGIPSLSRLASSPRTPTP